MSESNETEKPPIRVLLVDDHALFRDGIVSLFAYEPDFQVVGEAEDGESALRLARSERPNLVLMDIDLPGEDGVAVTRRLKSEQPDLSIVMLTVYDDTTKLLDAIKAGADGYLVKNIRSSELLEQLRGIFQGEAALSRRMATRILDEFRDRNLPQTPQAQLTQREQEVLELVGARMSNKEIAARLYISEHTVKNHLKNILGKLHVRSRREAADYGLARRWIRATDRQE